MDGLLSSSCFTGILCLYCLAVLLLCRVEVLATTSTSSCVSTYPMRRGISLLRWGDVMEVEKWTTEDKKSKKYYA